MYNTDPSLLEKFNEKIQTKGNDNNPNPLVYITRNKTANTITKILGKETCHFYSWYTFFRSRYADLMANL